MYSVVMICLCAVLCGMRSYAAIGHWAARAPQDVLRALESRVVASAFGVRAAPSGATIRRVIIGLDAGGLAGLGAIGLETVTMLSLDGKRAKGSGDRHTMANLVAAMTPDRRVVAQVRIDGDGDEIAAVQQLITGLNIKNRVITADALHTQNDTAAAISAAKGFYLLAVKGNRKSLYRQFKNLPWAQIPIASKTVETGHGRDETRTITVATMTKLPFPSATQVIAVRRWRRNRRTRKTSWELTFYITNIPPHLYNADDLASFIRSHWGIEILHHIRDTTFDEDRSQIRAGAGPQNMASLRNITIGLLSMMGINTIAKTLRDNHLLAYTQPLQILGLTQ
ncbi:MAG TPA: ISAs1 family transposase [Candidatus Stackebrandtia excrementipullorum]|nr:ISAs1 family transposase [Candidatus Stackebrandtia excrementipullorum]